MASTKHLAAALALLLAYPAAAEDPRRAVLKELRDDALEIQRETEGLEPPDWTTPDTAAPAYQEGTAAGRAAAEALPAILESQREAVCTTFDTDCALPEVTATPEYRWTLLVSRSLGEETLRAIAATAATEGVRMVFRGVAEGEPLMTFVREIHGYIRDLDPVPTIELDPRPFREAAAQSVPLLVLTGPEGEIARVAGITSARWLKTQVERGQRGDLGVRGPIREIAEPDMIEEIQRRVAQLDLEGMKTRAKASYWKRARFEHLERAFEPRERRIDPSIQINDDLLHPDGRVIARAGEVRNPLALAPFDLRLVVFDGTDPEQVAAAAKLGAMPGPLTTLYLSTRFDRDAGWEGYNRIEDRLDEPVYLLTPDLRNRFQLERVPATVVADGERFVVREHPPESLP